MPLFFAEARFRLRSRRQHALDLRDQRIGEARLGHERIAAACRAPSACPASACPVNATIGICRVRWSNFRRRVASHPSIRGRARSIRMMSGINWMRLLDRLLTVGGFGDTVTRELQIGSVHFPRILIVLDNQDQRLR